MAKELLQRCVLEDCELAPERSDKAVLLFQDGLCIEAIHSCGERYYLVEWKQAPERNGVLWPEAFRAVRELLHPLQDAHGQLLSTFRTPVAHPQGLSGRQGDAAPLVPGEVIFAVRRVDFDG